MMSQISLLTHILNPMGHKALKSCLHHMRSLAARCASQISLLISIAMPPLTQISGRV